MNVDQFGLGRARARFRGSVEAAAWLNETGLTARFADEVGLGLEAVRDGVMILTFPQRGEGGLAVQGRMDVGADGCQVVHGRGVPAPLWSVTPFDGADVVIASDPIIMWLLLQALGGTTAGIIVAARSHPGGLPISWERDETWSRFDSVTLLMDDPLATDALTNMLAAMPALDVAAAIPPSPCSDWRSYLASAHDARAVHAVIETAPPLERFVPARSSAMSRVEMSSRSVHDLDQDGRLRRVLLVEERHAGAGGGNGGSRRSPVVVRSDRKMLSVAPARAPAGTRTDDRILTLSDGGRLPAGPNLSSAGCGWSLASATAFAAGRTVARDASDLRSDLASMFAGHGLNARDAAGAAAFVILTYVYPAFGQLPLLVASAPDYTSRIRFARTMTALTYGGRMVGRVRARPLARLADATGGTLVLTDPGPLLAPSGPTEIGRFVLSSLAPDCGSEHESGPGGFRTLRTFGPRCMISADAPMLDWGDVLRIDVPTTPDLFAVSGDVRSLVDDLFVWSMSAIVGLRRTASGCVDGLSALAVIDPAFELITTAKDGSASVAPANPESVMRVALDYVRRQAGRTVTIAQLTMEAALLGGVGEAFTPERIGRWLAASGELEKGVEPGRRRLNGEIVRRYRLRSAADLSGDVADDAFGFCEKSVCHQCRYAGPCAELMPALRAAKARRAAV